MADDFDPTDPAALDAEESAEEQDTVDDNNDADPGDDEDTATDEDAAEDDDNGAEDEDEADPEDAPTKPKRYDKDPELRKYIASQVRKGIELETKRLGITQQPEPKPDPNTDPRVAAATEAVTKAKTALSKALASGTEDEVTEAQAALNDAQFDLRDAKRAVDSDGATARDQAVQRQIDIVKAQMTADGVKNVNELDKYLPFVDRSRGVETAYKLALNLRKAMAVAKQNGEKTALRKKNSETPGKPSGSQASKLFKPGDTLDDIAERGKTL